MIRKRTLSWRGQRRAEHDAAEGRDAGGGWSSGSRIHTVVSCLTISVHKHLSRPKKWPARGWHIHHGCMVLSILLELFDLDLETLKYYRQNVKSLVYSPYLALRIPQTPPRQTRPSRRRQPASPRNPECDRGRPGASRSSSAQPQSTGSEEGISGGWRELFLDLLRGPLYFPPASTFSLRDLSAAWLRSSLAPPRLLRAAPLYCPD